MSLQFIHFWGRKSHNLEQNFDENICCTVLIYGVVLVKMQRLSELLKTVHKIVWNYDYSEQIIIFSFTESYVPDLSHQRSLQEHLPFKKQ